MKTSKDASKAAIQMAITESFDEEKALKERFARNGIQAAAVNIGGNMIASIPKIFESALVSAKRNGVIEDGSHVYDGALIGATREAVDQIIQKATGLDGGGKIGIARAHEHLAVCIFLSVGLMHLDELVISLGHRVIPE